MQIGLTAQWSPSVTLPDVRNEVFQVHRAVGSVVAPVVHLAAPVGTQTLQVPDKWLQTAPVSSDFETKLQCSIN